MPLGKSMKHLYLYKYRSDSTTAFFYKDSLGIK